MGGRGARSTAGGVSPAPEAPPFAPNAGENLVNASQDAHTQAQRDFTSALKTDTNYMTRSGYGRPEKLKTDASVARIKVVHDKLSSELNKLGDKVSPVSAKYAAANLAKIKVMLDFADRNFKH